MEKGNVWDRVDLVPSWALQKDHETTMSKSFDRMSPKFLAESIKIKTLTKENEQGAGDYRSGHVDLFLACNS